MWDMPKTMFVTVKVTKEMEFSGTILYDTNEVQNHSFVEVVSYLFLYLNKPVLHNFDHS